jgi:hypothetical protein
MSGTRKCLPSRGGRVEQLRTGIRRVGRVWYADEPQILVKWDDGGSSSLRIGKDKFRPIATADAAR